MKSPEEAWGGGAGQGDRQRKIRATHVWQCPGKCWRKVAKLIWEELGLCR